MENIYKEKYLFYKHKYIELKKQFGSAPLNSKEEKIRNILYQIKKKAIQKIVTNLNKSINKYSKSTNESNIINYLLSLNFTYNDINKIQQTTNFKNLDNATLVDIEIDSSSGNPGINLISRINIENIIQNDKIYTAIVIDTDNNEQIKKLIRYIFSLNPSQG